MANSETDVVIAGAGPVGMTLALLLAQRGHRIVVLDKKAKLSPFSRAVALFPRSLEILNEVGVLEQIVRLGEVNHHIRMRAADRHQTLLDFPFSDLEAVTAIDYMVAISQDRTERILLDQLSQHTTAQVCFSSELLSFDATAAGVEVQIKEMTGERTISARYLVGCDGAGSVVRGLLGLELEGKTYPTRAFLGDVRVTQEADSNDGWKVATDLPGFISCIRYAERTWRIIDQAVEINRSEAEERAHALALGQVLFGPEGIEEVLWCSTYRKHERQASAFRDGRVVLAGDAAHLNSPAGGQGMNSGLRDAFNLGWKLDLCLAGLGDEDRLLDSYQVEQANAFRSAVGPFTEIIEKIQTAPVWVRKVLFKSVWLGRALNVEEKLARNLSMLFVEYGQSPILRPDSELVGRRMPNLMLTTGRLFKQIGRFGLILDRDGDAVMQQRSASMGIPIARLPRGLDELGFSGVETLFIRPDHIVALAAPTHLTIEQVGAALALSDGVALPRSHHHTAQGDGPMSELVESK